MLHKMVSGEWRGVKPPWAGDEDLEEECLQFLEGIVWRLFSKATELNRFTLNDWKEAAGRTLGELEEASISSRELRRELQRVGFLVPAGFDERGDRCWSVIHRTFLEFLAARALSRMERNIWLTAVFARMKRTAG